MGMSDLALEMEEQHYDDCADEAERLNTEYQEALYYIDEFQAIVENENNYADFSLVNGKIVEYQEILIEYEKHPSEKGSNELQELKQAVIDMAKKLETLMPTIPISEKKRITVKDFEKLYSISEEAQRRLRTRLPHNDPLPYTQIEKRGNILYDCVEIEKWFENYKN